MAVLVEGGREAAVWAAGMRAAAAWEGEGWAVGEGGEASVEVGWEEAGWATAT